MNMLDKLVIDKLLNVNFNVHFNFCSTKYCHLLHILSDRISSCKGKYDKIFIKQSSFKTDKILYCVSSFVFCKQTLIYWMNKFFWK